MQLEQILTQQGIEELGPVVHQNTEEQKEDPTSPIIVTENQMPFFQEQMLRAIDEVDQYAWKRGEIGGLDWGFESLNKAFEGLNTGLHLIAGQSNVGKSAMCMQLAWQIANNNREVTEKRNKKAFVLYISLDDNLNELLPRFVAIDQKIPINAVRFPKKYQHKQEYMEKRQKGFERLKEMTTNLAMLDINSGGSDIEYIESKIKEYATELERIDPNYQIVVFIDNFHDITIQKYPSMSEVEKYNYIADQLSQIATKFDCPIVCTAEFRKLNGNRRPRLDDIRESVKIVYEARVIMLCYNEVSLRDQNASIYFMDPANYPGQKMPVFEMQVGKNKFGSFKGRLFFEFFPEMSFFREPDEAKRQQYVQMVSN